MGIYIGTAASYSNDVWPPDRFPRSLRFLPQFSKTHTSFTKSAPLLSRMSTINLARALIDEKNSWEQGKHCRFSWLESRNIEWQNHMQYLAVGDV